MGKQNRVSTITCDTSNQYFKKREIDFIIRIDDKPKEWFQVHKDFNFGLFNVPILALNLDI